MSTAVAEAGGSSAGILSYFGNPCAEIIAAPGHSRAPAFYL